ncbi:MAG: HEAT repeat domain-containing protein [Acidobacteriia bacterium]|nr:HEAT repeat domain-containing protein [Terriglobia bacterium]
MKMVIPKSFVLALLILFHPGGKAARADGSRDQAWEILRVNLNEKSADKRAQAVRALGLLPGNSRALQYAEKAAADEKPEVRVAAATALAQLHGKESAAMLRKMLSDAEPSVVLAAAGALVPSKDPDAYEAYYEFLTGERKTGRGMIADQMKTLKDPKKMAEMGFTQGIGLIPYAGIGYSVFEMLRADDVSPIRAAAARSLANDPDPESGKALVMAVADKSWLVKTAALEAIARRADPALRDAIVSAMTDDNISVRCTAAAAVIRLSTKDGTPQKKP